MSSLRTHLARLTSELASHRSFIAELRADADAAGETQAEVEALRAEVERLAGEVERLKEIVEEGLRERRRARLDSDVGGGQTTSPPQVGIDLTYVTVPLSRGEEREEPLTVDDLEPDQEQAPESEAPQGRDAVHVPLDPRPRRFIDVRLLTYSQDADFTILVITGF